MNKYIILSLKVMITCLITLFYMNDIYAATVVIGDDQVITADPPDTNIIGSGEYAVNFQFWHSSGNYWSTYQGDIQDRDLDYDLKDDAKINAILVDPLNYEYALSDTMRDKILSDTM